MSSAPDLWLAAPDHRAGRGPTLVHRLPPESKILALVAFALVVVATPGAAWPAYLVDATLLVGVAVLARLDPRSLLRRGVVEVPVLVFVAILPFVAADPRVEVAGLQVSQTGLAAAGTLLAKATLGIFAALILAGTTDARALLGGLERLRLPATLVAILSFMLRYVSIMIDDLRRLRLARLARGGTPRGHLAAVAGGVGLLFVRGYERGERVQQAMIARGYRGRMPPLGQLSPRVTATAGAWALLLPVGALLSWVGTEVVRSVVLAP